jgi:hypothetical protein
MASMAEISVSMDRLVDVMPPPRGVDARKAFDAYCTALAKFTPAEIDEGIRRFLAGECDEKISLKFYPRPPELARIVAGVHAENAKVAHEQARLDRLAEERREQDESEKLRIKTPEQKARVAEIMARFHAGLPVHDPVNRPTDRDPWFVERTGDPFRARDPAQVAVEDAAADLQLRTGMTDEQFGEAMAAIPDRNPLPPGMVQVGDAVPGVPAPPPDRIRRDEQLPGKLDPVEALAFDDIGEFLKANT